MARPKRNSNIPKIIERTSPFIDICFIKFLLKNSTNLNSQTQTQKGFMIVHLVFIITTIILTELMNNAAIQIKIVTLIGLI